MTNSVTIGRVLTCSALWCSTACGGSTTAPTTSLDPASAFATLNVAASQQIGGFIDASGNPATGANQTLNSNVPTTQTAAYSGALAGTLDGAGLVADLAIDVNFATEQITASADGFVHETSGTMAGTLSGSGTVNAGPSTALPQVTFDLIGDLTRDGQNETALLALDGNFFTVGSDPVAVAAGTVEGDVGGDNLTEGLFAAE